MSVVPNPAEVPRGYLILGVEEATGKTQTSPCTWDTTSQGTPFEAFVKVELRGGSRNIKAQTKKAGLVDDTVTWQEELRMEVLDGSNELRLMLCREKYNNGKKGTAVIAACGIFVSDILDAVPIDKYFELFKPNAGGEGGYIRISMNYVKDLAQLNNKAPAQTAGAADGTTAAGGSAKKGGALRKVLGWVLTIGILGGAAAGIALAVNKKKADKDKKAATPLASSSKKK